MFENISLAKINTEIIYSVESINPSLNIGRDTWSYLWSIDNNNVLNAGVILSLNNNREVAIRWNRVTNSEEYFVLKCKVTIPSNIKLSVYNFENKIKVIL